MSTGLAIALMLVAAQREPSSHRSAETRRPQQLPGATRPGPRMEHRLSSCAPSGTRCFPHDSCAIPLHRRFVVEAVTSSVIFAPPGGIIPVGVGPFDPFGFGGLALIPWNDPVFVRPAPAIAQPVEPRGMPQIVPPAGARAATTDIPERFVEDLLGRRRPSLAQRAQAARLEAGGDTMFHAGYFARAAERYQQALAQAPDNDEAKFKRGAALATAGQYGEAIRVLRDALHDRPDWPFVPHDLLALFPDEAAVDRLLENLDREARRPDADFDLLFLRAYILYYTGQRDAAEAIFRNPPVGGVPPAHFQLFQQAIERGRQAQ